MKYYRVKKNSDGVTICKCIRGKYAYPVRLNGGELFTEREMEHLRQTCVFGLDALEAFEEVEVKRTDTYKNRYDERFECGYFDRI